MEGEGIDYSPIAKEAFNSILEFNQEGLQAGQYDESRDLDLFETTLQ